MVNRLCESTFMMEVIDSSDNTQGLGLGTKFLSFNGVILYVSFSYKIYRCNTK